MTLRTYLRFLRLTPLLAGLALAGPAEAWKPKTHVYLAEIARRDALDGKVTLYYTDYATGRVMRQLGEFEVDPRIQQALRHNGPQFRAGVVGPDAYPDMLTGQQLIHPGTNMAHPGDAAVGENASAPGTDAWLTHIWRAAYGRAPMIDQAAIQLGGGVAGTHYQAPPSTLQSPATQAFAVGYIVHAAGDMFMHTFVNHFTGGDFAISPDPRNAIKHVVLEGYVGTRTPKLTGDLGTSINNLDQFIYTTMVDGRPGTILYNRLMQGAGAGTSVPAVFSALRARLQNDVDAYERARLARRGPERLAYAGVNGPEAEYKKAWIADIDRGLRAWPVTSYMISEQMIYNEHDSTSISEAKYHATEYMWKYGFSMMGVPDAVIAPINLVRAILAALPTPFQALIDAIKKALLDWLVRSATGKSPEELESYLKDPAHHFDSVMNSAGGGYGGRTETLTNLADFNRNVLGIDDPSTQNKELYFDFMRFPPAFNTVQMTKIAFLSEKGMADLRAALRAKGAEFPAHSGKYENPMLGFLTSIDGDNRWQQGPGHHGHLFARGNAAAWRLLFLPQLGEKADWTGSPGIDRPVAEKPPETPTPAPVETVTAEQLEALKAIAGDYTTNAGTILTVAVDGPRVTGRATTRAVGRPLREQLALTVTPTNELVGTWRLEVGHETTLGKVSLRFADDAMSFAGTVQTSVNQPSFEYRGERVRPPVTGTGDNPAAPPAEPGASGFTDAGYFSLRVDAVGRTGAAPIEVAMTARNSQGERRGVQYNDNVFILVGSDGREYRSDGNFYGKSGAERLNATVWLTQDEQTAVTYLFPGVPSSVTPVRLVVRDRTKDLGTFALENLPKTRPAAVAPTGAEARDLGQANVLEGFTAQLVSTSRGVDGAWEAVVSLRNTGEGPLHLSPRTFRMTLLDADGDTRQATGDIYEPEGSGRRAIGRFPTLAPGAEFRLKLVFPESATMTPTRYKVEDATGKSAIGTVPAGSAPALTPP